MAIPLPQLDRPLRIGLLTNPASGRTRRHLPELRRLMRDAPAVVYREARNPDEVQSAVLGLGEHHLDLLAINGGDGTVQAVLTCLFGTRTLAEPPLLAVLPGGTSNVTAADVGCKGQLEKALRRVLALSRKGSADAMVISRPVLRVDVPSTNTPKYGMVFGAGAIVRGIEYCHEQVYGRGVRGQLVPGICTLRVLLAMVRNDARYVAPVPMAVATTAGQRQEPVLVPEQEYLLVLASALERLFFGVRPYWGQAHGAFHFTSIRSRPAHPLRNLPQLFWGRPGATATPENGYRSENLDELRLEMDGPFTLDGEIYRASRRSGPVRVTLGGRVEFMKI